MSNRVIRLGKAPAKIDMEHESFRDAAEDALRGHAVDVQNVNGAVIARIVPTDWIGPPGTAQVQTEAGNLYRTRTGKILTDHDIERLSAEAERGYDPHALVTARRERQQRQVHRMASVVDALLGVTALQPHMIGLPWHGEAESGDRHDFLKKWLMGDE